MSQEIIMEPEEKTAALGTSSEQETRHNLLTALESKIEQLHSVMQNEDLEGTIHQVVDKLRQDSETESEAEKKHTDLHIAVDNLKSKLAEKSKQLKSYELALKTTTQQLEELALISETRLKNAAEHGSRAPGLTTTTTADDVCQGCGLPDQGFQLRKAELLELEDARRQLEMRNEILVQSLNARDKLIADLEGAILQFENQLDSQQQQASVGLYTPPPGEVKCKTCGLSKLELDVLSDARRQLAETNDVLLHGLNVRNKQIKQLEGKIQQFESGLQEAQASLQQADMLIAARDNRIQRLEMELLCSAAAAASTPLQPPPSQEQKGASLAYAGQKGSNPPSCAGQIQEQKTPNSLCPVTRKSMQSPPMMSDTMRYAYEHAKEALHSVDASLDGGDSGPGHCPIQGAFARMGVCTMSRAQEETASRSVVGTRNQDQPIPSHKEFYSHADPATTYRLRHTDSSSDQDVSVPYSTVVELSRQQQTTTGWISDFPQPFHSSSMHATAASRSTSGASSPSQELLPLADVAGTYHPSYPLNKLH